MTVRNVGSLGRDIAGARRGGAFSPRERTAAETIVRAVRRNGDAGVLRTVRRFDNRSARPRDLVLDSRAIQRAAARPAETRARSFDSPDRAFHELAGPR